MLLLAALVLDVHAGPLAGTVYGANGQTIVGAEVLAINSRLQAAVAETDQNGHYRFVGLPDGRYRLLATPPTGDVHAPRYFPSARGLCEGNLVSTGDASLTVDIDLPLGFTLSGRVLDVEGAPLSGVRVKANSESGYHNRDGHTDDDGRFAITGLEPQGDWSISAFVSGHPLQWFGQTYAAEESTWVTTLEDTELGDWALLDGIGVSGIVDGPAGPVSEALVRVFSGGQVSQTTTDESGVYEAIGLPPGDVTSWAAAEGYATTYLPDADRPTTSVPVTEEGEWREGLDITMPEETTLSVQLTGEAPRTLGDLSGLPLVLYNDTQSVGRAAQTDRDGMAEFRGLHPGQYTLYTYGGDAGHSDDWVRDASGTIMTIELDGEVLDEVITLPLAPAVTVVGTVVDDHGFPVPGAAVVINDASDDDEDELSTFFLTATSDDNGQFEAVGVPAGTWTVAALSQSLCLSDPGHVTVYWPNEVDPVMAERLTTSLDNPVVSMHFTLPRDGDHDAMGDRWERRHGLDLSRDDGAEDPDNDGLTNLVEFRLRTNPNAPEGEWIVEQNCGCAVGGTRRDGWMLLGLAALVGLRRRSDAT